MGIDDDLKAVKRHRLFASSDADGRYDALIGFGLDNWIGYVGGYKRAGGFLVAHVLETLRDHDYLVFPIIFLYRQHLELHFKHLITLGGELLEEAIEYPKIHRLGDLWTRCRDIIKQVWPESAEAELIIIDQVVADLSEVDPNSMAFRYPTDKHGSPSLPGVERIDLAHFGKVMDEASQTLDGIAAAMQVERDLRMEMRRHYQGGGCSF